MEQSELQETTYRVQELSDGFLIGSPVRGMVHVGYQPTHFYIWCADGHPIRIGLIEYRRLIDSIAWELMRNWKPPRRDRKPWPGIKGWAVGKTKRAIASLVYHQWQSHLNRLDPQVIAIQKAVFAATLGTARITLSDDFYKDRYLVSDVLNYRAAAIAARHIYSLAETKRRYQILNSRSVFNLRKAVEDLGGLVEISADVLKIDENTALNFLSSWQGLFSQSYPYTSLTRTLTNLPGGIPSGLILQLPQSKLLRPVYRRLELMVILLAAEHSNTINHRVFHFALHDRICAAMRIVANSIGKTLNPRCFRHVEWFVTQMAAFPDLHRGNIVGLAEKAVKAHRNNSERRVKETIRQYGIESQLQPPPIQLPKNPEIRFLDSAADICKEGILMGHCVETLIPDAIEGTAFIFHVEKFGQSATVCVDGSGQVQQSQGPFNDTNRASRWATRTLKQWAKAFPRRSEIDHASAVENVLSCDTNEAEVPF